jgi:hypothetical protein
MFTWLFDMGKNDISNKKKIIGKKFVCGSFFLRFLRENMKWRNCNYRSNKYIQILSWICHISPVQCNEVKIWGMCLIYLFDMSLYQYNWSKKKFLYDDLYDKIVIFLKVALNTITPNPFIVFFVEYRRSYLLFMFLW